MAYRAICRKIDEGKMEIYGENHDLTYRSTRSHKKRPETKTELLTTYNEGFTIPHKHDIINLQNVR